MTGALYFYKLVSPYPNDITKNCKLTINEIDSNFLTLKDADIATAEFDRENKLLVLTRNNGEKLIVDLRDVTYNLEVGTGMTESGMTITISFDGTEGKQLIQIDNLVTLDFLIDMIDDLLDEEFGKRMKVVTDGTLKGNGTVSSPLGINGTERTGTLAPVKRVVDLTGGGKLPDAARLGTRYVTIEETNEYGYLYDECGMKKIEEDLEKDGKGWRIPTKADWDALLNSLEPCDHQNHDSEKCHVMLGLLAGKFLKSECGWYGQEECNCSGSKECICDEDIPESGDSLVNIDDMFKPIDCTDENDQDAAARVVDPSGVDLFGMAIRPSGKGTIDSLGEVHYSDFGKSTYFWTNTHVHADIDQDKYVKVFDFNRGGVIQEADCPDLFYSIRLVKDYDGENYFDTEYIDGVAYKTILFPDTQQVWLATNYASKNGFIAEGEELVPDECHEFDSGCTRTNVLDVNGGEGVSPKRSLFINEWNGRYWEKRQMKDGETVVVECDCPISGSSSGSSSGESGSTVENAEYRVYTDEDCNQYMVNTDDAVYERIMDEILPVVEEMIDDKLEDYYTKDEVDDKFYTKDDIDDVLGSGFTVGESGETVTDVINELIDEINEKADADDVYTKEEVDADQLRQDEITSAIAEHVDAIDGRMLVPGEYTLKPNDGTVIPSEDGDDEHAITLKVDWDFGEI